VLFWIVLAGVLVAALVVLGVVAYGVLGAFGRLGRELEGAERDARPFLDQVQATVDRADRMAVAAADRR
jgi:hypothetical protein